MNKEKWEIKKLGEICETITKGTTPTTLGYQFVEEGVNFVKIEAIDINGNIINENLAYINEECHNALRRSQLEKDDLLFSIAGAIGRTAIVNENIIPANINQALAIIRLKNKNSLFLRFLIYLFKSQLVVAQINNYKVGVAQLNVSLTQLHNLQIPIPPLSTQEKIVSELDTLHRLKELQEQQLAELDNLAQSTFYHLFGDPIENEKGWEVKKLGEFTRIINGRAYKQEELLKEGKTPVLRVGNFFSNKDFYYSNLELDKDKYCDYGDLLYAWSASFGAKIWDGGKVIYHYHIWKIEINESICNKIFLFNILNLKTNYLKEQTHGIAMLHLTKSGMEDTNFILPPLSLQTQFSERIEKIETQKELIKQSIAETQTLIDYTMDKYFG